MTVGQDAEHAAPAHRRSAEPGAPAHRTAATIAVVVGLVGELLITLGVLLGLSARQRYIVHAVLDYWMPTADGVPSEITGGA